MIKNLRKKAFVIVSKAFFLKSITIILFMLSLFEAKASQFYFEYSPNTVLAFQKILNLELDEAKSIADRIRITEPFNLSIIQLDNKIDFFNVFITENRELFERTKEKDKQRLDQLNKLSISNKYKLLIQSEIYIHAALNNIRFGSYFQTISNLSTAYKLVKENQSLYPEFIGNIKNLGLIYYIIGAIPSKFHSTLKLFTGLEGTFEKGESTFKYIFQDPNYEHYLFKDEIVVIYSFVNSYLKKNQTKVIELISKSTIGDRINIGKFLLANSYIKEKKFDLAIKNLKSISRGGKYLKFIHVDYLLGKLLLDQLDTNALFYLNNYLNDYSGLNFKLDCALRITWANIIFYGKDVNLNLPQASNLERDESANYQFSNKSSWNIFLIKSRLLFDGGKYQESIDVLEKFTHNYNKNTEYFYRKARCYHLLQNYEEASKNYNLVILKGKNSKAPFACKAAYFLGELEFTRANYSIAEKAYKSCLDISPEIYGDSLHRLAKQKLRKLSQIND